MKPSEDVAPGSIERSLLECPDRQFREAVAVLERTRTNPGIGRLLGSLRRRLGKLRPHRQLDLRRLFYMPVEDLLESRADEDAPDAITRDAMDSAWNMVRAAGEPPAWAALEQACASPGQEDEKVSTLGPSVWASGARLTGELEHIAVLFQGAEALMGLWRRLPPKPIRHLSPDQLNDIRTLVEDHANGDPKRTFIFLKAIMARLAVPATFVQQLADLSCGLGQDEQRELSNRLQLLIVKELTRREPEAALAAEADLIHQAELLDDLVSAISAAKRFSLPGPASDALVRLQNTAQRMVGGVVDDASHTVRRGIEDGTLAPIAAREAAENSLMALRYCQSFAPAVGMDEKIEESLREIVDRVHGQASAILASPTGAQGAAQEVSDQLYWSIRLLELAGRSEEAGKLWEDGAALLRGATTDTAS